MRTSESGNFANYSGRVHVYSDIILLVFNQEAVTTFKLAIISNFDNCSTRKVVPSASESDLHSNVENDSTSVHRLNLDHENLPLLMIGPANFRSCPIPHEGRLKITPITNQGPEFIEIKLGRGVLVRFGNSSVSRWKSIANLLLCQFGFDCHGLSFHPTW